MNFPLPEHYRPAEVWAFHGRDPQQVAEATTPTTLRKAFFTHQPELVELTRTERIVGTGPEGVARRLLGLTLDPTPFEVAFEQDPYLGTLIQQRRGLRIAQAATPFEAVTWAIMGQQVNLNFALTMRRTFIQLAGVPHQDLLCYPGPEQVARLDPDDLHQRQFSRAKANTLVGLARALTEGQLDLEADPPEKLLERKGIGPWTVHYTLLRGYAHPDCSLHGDVAVRKGMSQAWQRPLEGREAEQLLERYRPYRSLAAAHFWASLTP